MARIGSNQLILLAGNIDSLFVIYSQIVCVRLCNEHIRRNHVSRMFGIFLSIMFLFVEILRDGHQNMIHIESSCFVLHGIAEVFTVIQPVGVFGELICVLCESIITFCCHKRVGLEA